MNPEIVNLVNRSRDEAVEELFEFLRIPSVSADSAFQQDMLRCAEFVQEAMQKAGLTSEIIPTDGHPIVYAERIEGDDRPTILIYGHYDVQPPDPLDAWTTPPFDPQIRDGRIYARGATDDKGQLFTHIKSIEAWVSAVGTLPVNVKFLVEGEEEVGSDHLDKFLEENRERLKSDVAVISDTSQYGDGIPAITYGLRGIIAAEVHLTGPSKDLHSGIFGGSIANPANAITLLCGSLLDADGCVQIPGFYDDIEPVTAAERAQFSKLPFSLETFLETTGSSDIWGEQGWSTLERRWIRPTCDINGIISGYTGEGPKTIVPSWAKAKITCRLVPGQNPDAILNSLEQFLRQQCPDGLNFQFSRFHGCPAFVFDPTSKWITAASQAVAAAFGSDPVFIREGGSIPVVMSFKQILDVDTLLLGWGRNSDNLHSPDEHIHLADFHNGVMASTMLWHSLSNVEPD
jgi:acetylornithine deacetylase/succinyl-diaminopimelate desuccinylase-like protein